MAKLPLLFVLLVHSAGCEIARSDREEPPGRLLGAQATDDKFSECLSKLVPHEAAVKTSIHRQYRLSESDSYDLVRDAMMRVCMRDQVTPIRRHETALRTAAQNAAKDGWRHNRRYPRCAVDDALPACPAASEPLARFEQELQLVEAALCKEDGATQRIIRLRVQEDLDFATIGQQLGISADKARERFHNGIKRVARRVREQCPS